MFGKRFFEMRHLRDFFSLFLRFERNYCNSQLNILEYGELFNKLYLFFELPLYQYICYIKYLWSMFDHIKKREKEYFHYMLFIEHNSDSCLFRLIFINRKTSFQLLYLTSILLNLMMYASILYIRKTISWSQLNLFDRNAL